MQKITKKEEHVGPEVTQIITGQKLDQIFYCDFSTLFTDSWAARF